MVVVCDKTGGGASSDAPIGPIHRQLLPVQYSTYLDTYFDLKYFPLSSHSLQFSHGLTSGCYGPSLCTWKLVSALSRMGVSRIHCMSRRDSRHDSLASASHISSTTATSTLPGTHLLIMSEPLYPNKPWEKFEGISDPARMTLWCCLHCHESPGSQEDGRLRRCSHCFSAFYCSRECQKADWTRHK